MTLGDLKILGLRLANGPVPTQAKKVYAYEGPLQDLLEALPGTVTIKSSVLDAIEGSSLPQQEESLPRFIQERIARHVQARRKERKTSVLILEDAELLARYRMPMTFLYPLVGDAHAIILHIARGGMPKEWKVPSYVRFDPSETTKFFEQSLSDQYIQATVTEG